MTNVVQNATKNQVQNPDQILEKNLHERFSFYGKNAKEWTRKCALLLPEINRLRIWEKKGFEHYGYVFENVSKGKAIGFKIEYVKKDRLPSVDIKYSPMTEPKTWDSPYETPRRKWVILYVAGGVGLLFVIGMLWLVF